MDIRSLRYFVHIVRAKSFTKAAVELRVAQPALSRQVQRLEEELGVRLLDRQGRRIELTKAGFMLMERAEAVLGLIAETQEYVSQGNDTIVGNVVLGLPPMAGAKLAPPIADHYRRVWPQISLRLLEGGSNSLHEWILDRRIDLAALYNPAPLDDLDIEPILYEPTMLVGPPADSQSTLPDIRGPISVGDMADLPLILPALPHTNRRMVESAAAQYGIRLKLVNEVDSIGLIKAMVGYGLGFTISTFASVQKEVSLGELRAHPIDKPPLVSTFAIVRRRELRGSWLITELAATVRRSLTGLMASGEWKGGTPDRGVGSDA